MCIYIYIYIVPFSYMYITYVICLHTYSMFIDSSKVAPAVGSQARPYLPSKLIKGGCSGNRV